MDSGTVYLRETENARPKSSESVSSSKKFLCISLQDGGIYGLHSAAWTLPGSETEILKKKGNFIMTKRLISLVLALVLAVSTLALPSLAATKPGPDAEIETAYKTCPYCGTTIAAYTPTRTTTTTRTCLKNMTQPHSHTERRTYEIFDCPKSGCTYYLERVTDYSDECHW